MRTPHVATRRHIAPARTDVLAVASACATLAHRVSLEIPAIPIEQEVTPRVLQQSDLSSSGSVSFTIDPASDSVTANTPGAIISTVVLEGFSLSAETTLELGIGGGAAMSSSTVALPVPYNMTVDKVAVSFLTAGTPGDWTARIYRRSPTFPLAEVGTMTFQTS